MDPEKIERPHVPTEALPDSTPEESELMVRYADLIGKVYEWNVADEEWGRVNAEFSRLHQDLAHRPSHEVDELWSRTYRLVMDRGYLSSVREALRALQHAGGEATRTQVREAILSIVRIEGTDVPMRTQDECREELLRWGESHGTIVQDVGKEILAERAARIGGNKKHG